MSCVEGHYACTHEIQGEEHQEVEEDAIMNELKKYGLVD
jgi:hypothetical protein